MPLFERSPIGLTLTADAEALYAVLSQSFSRTAETVQAIRSRNRTKRVTLACTHAFASQWLMRRMGEFWRRLPGDQRRSPDLRRRPGIPACRGRPSDPLRLGAWPDEASALLMTETIYPIAGAGFARLHAGCVAP